MYQKGFNNLLVVAILTQGQVKIQNYFFGICFRGFPKVSWILNIGNHSHFMI